MERNYTRPAPQMNPQGVRLVKKILSLIGSERIVGSVRSRFNY
jgi:hypothetical protein